MVMRQKSSKAITALLFLLIIALPMSAAAAAGIKEGAKCPDSQFLKTVKSGSKYLMCVTGNNGYIFWQSVPPPPPPKSAYYTRGYNAIINATQQGLYDYGFYQYLNGRNVMTQTNAINWCNHVLFLISRTSNSVDGWSTTQQVDWEKGCAAAAQAL